MLILRQEAIVVLPNVMVHSGNERLSFGDLLPILGVLFPLFDVFLLQKSIVAVRDVLVVMEEAAPRELFHAGRRGLPDNVFLLLIPKHLQNSVWQ